ncbi:MAG: AraC family transcriptional regulator [Prevotella sp.]|nr:AraC family transcriptional regulator [Prevotella sp.]
MRQLLNLLLICVILALTTGCTNSRTTGQHSDADSIYTWECIRQFIMEQPEHALGLVDTAKMRGLADVNLADWMRAQVYYNAPAVEDMGKARDYCLQVLERRNPAADSVQKLKTLSLLVNICAYLPNTYQDAVRYAIQGAGMAHHAGDILQEANFYFEAGKVMERQQQGSGMDYMKRSMNILREASRDSIQPLPTLSSDLGNTARILAGQENYAAAIPLLQEKLQVISRIEKENPNAPAGWADQQRAYTYPVLAYCQQMAGDKEGAHLSAEAFEQTQAAQEPINQKDMLNYYALAGNAGRIQQIYDRLEPLLREKEDTISWRYADLLYMYAMGLNNIGRYREAYQTQARYQVINDSLVQRERQAETLELAQQMKTQEKELQLKDEEAKTTVYRILAFSLVAIMLVIIVALWRLAIAHRRVLIKNRELFEIIQREQQREVRDIERIARQPEKERTPNEQLFLRLTELMKKEQPYTDSELNRDTLASMLATNHRYVDEAIRECSDSPSTKAFIDGYRVDHAARLLTDTDEPIALIAEMSGFANRTSFNERFRERYKMTPSEYRKAAKA